ncbi:MAG: hypothetical protein PHN49_10960, partial [Candidatus Omnitrophica bacterium]|nr:hypothetical protein [Candidatus Omnitrophota bacterium]
VALEVLPVYHGRKQFEYKFIIRLNTGHGAMDLYLSDPAVLEMAGDRHSVLTVKSNEETLQASAPQNAEAGKITHQINFELEAPPADQLETQGFKNPVQWLTAHVRDYYDLGYRRLLLGPGTLQLAVLHNLSPYSPGAYTSCYGTPDDFAKLQEAAGKIGLEIALDIVAGHTDGFRHPLPSGDYVQVLRNGEMLPLATWGTRIDDQNPEAIGHLIWWLTRTGIKTIRADLAGATSAWLWWELRKRGFKIISEFEAREFQVPFDEIYFKAYRKLMSRRDAQGKVAETSFKELEEMVLHGGQVGDEWLYGMDMLVAPRRFLINPDDHDENQYGGGAGAFVRGLPREQALQRLKAIWAAATILYLTYPDRISIMDYSPDRTGQYERPVSFMFGGPAGGPSSYLEGDADFADFHNRLFRLASETTEQKMPSQRIQTDNDFVAAVVMGSGEDRKLLITNLSFQEVEVTLAIPGGETRNIKLQANAAEIIPWSALTVARSEARQDPAGSLRRSFSEASSRQEAGRSQNITDERLPSAVVRPEARLVEDTARSEVRTFPFLSESQEQAWEQFVKLLPPENRAGIIDAIFSAYQDEKHYEKPETTGRAEAMIYWILELPLDEQRLLVRLAIQLIFDRHWSYTFSDALRSGYSLRRHPERTHRGLWEYILSVEEGAIGREEHSTQWLTAESTTGRPLLFEFFCAFTSTPHEPDLTPLMAPLEIFARDVVRELDAIGLTAKKVDIRFGRGVWYKKHHLGGISYAQFYMSVLNENGREIYLWDNIQPGHIWPLSAEALGLSLSSYQFAIYGGDMHKYPWLDAFSTVRGTLLEMLGAGFEEMDFGFVSPAVGRRFPQFEPLATRADEFLGMALQKKREWDRRVPGKSSSAILWGLPDRQRPGFVQLAVKDPTGKVMASAAFDWKSFRFDEFRDSHRSEMRNSEHGIRTEDSPFRTPQSAFRIQTERSEMRGPVDLESELRELTDEEQEIERKLQILFREAGVLMHSRQTDFGYYAALDRRRSHGSTDAMDLPETDRVEILDPGSGQGAYILRLALRYHGVRHVRLTGIEGDQKLFDNSQKLLSKAIEFGWLDEGEVEFKHGDYNEKTFAPYFQAADIVVYYNNGTNEVEKLADTLKGHLLKPGSRIFVIGSTNDLGPLLVEGDEPLFEPITESPFEWLHAYRRRSEVSKEFVGSRQEAGSSQNVTGELTAASRLLPPPAVLRSEARGDDPLLNRIVFVPHLNPGDDGVPVWLQTEIEQLIQDDEEIRAQLTRGIGEAKTLEVQMGKWTSSSDQGDDFTLKLSREDFGDENRFDAADLRQALFEETGHLALMGEGRQSVVDVYLAKTPAPIGEMIPGRVATIIQALLDFELFVDQIRHGYAESVLGVFRRLFPSPSPYQQFSADELRDFYMVKSLDIDLKYALYYLLIRSLLLNKEKMDARAIDEIERSLEECFEWIPLGVRTLLRHSIDRIIPLDVLRSRSWSDSYEGFWRFVTQIFDALEGPVYVKRVEERYGKGKDERSEIRAEPMRDAESGIRNEDQPFRASQSAFPIQEGRSETRLTISTVELSSLAQAKRRTLLTKAASINRRLDWETDQPVRGLTPESVADPGWMIEAFDTQGRLIAYAWLLWKTGDRRAVLHDLGFPPEWLGEDNGQAAGFLLETVNHFLWGKKIRELEVRLDVNNP